MHYIPEPKFLGLPAQFESWRTNQSDAISRILTSEKPVVLPVCPTGFGKSLMYVASSVLFGGKTIILTSTKGLQDQLMRDFAEVGMVEVKGKNAYLCPMSDNKLTCEEGPCSVGLRCEFKKTICPSHIAVEQARKARLVVTNYSFFFYSNRYSEGIGTPSVLICDEGHDAPNAVASFLTVEFQRREEDLIHILPDNAEELTIPDWVEWANNRYELIADELEELTEELKDGDGSDRKFRRANRMRRLMSQVSDLRDMTEDNWVCDVSPLAVSFAPIDVRSKCKDLLYGNAAHVVLTSASVNYKTAELLGLDTGNCEILEYPHTFPVENRLVIHVQGARMNARASGEDFKEWLDTADRIIDDRLDRKGIFHTTSYARRDFVMAHSRFAPYMMTHQRKDITQRIMEFKNGKPPLILVSPAVTTGWDFPYDQAEYQIIGKIAYPDTRNKITRARCGADPEYAPYIAMQQLVQTCGRGTRAVDDLCENFVIDDLVKWFTGPRGFRKFAPKWFLESLTSRIFPPAPPANFKNKLERTSD